MSVDLPAPLSPTRAVTLPGYALRLTPLSTLTGPKALTIPVNSMIGTSMPWFLSNFVVRTLSANVHPLAARVGGGMRRGSGSALRPGPEPRSSVRFGTQSVTG